MSVNHEKFFRQHGEQLLEACFYGVCTTFTVEELYQAFRERLRAEPPPSRAERLARLHAEIDELIASDSDGGECD